MSFSDRIKIARERKNFSQQQLGGFLGVTDGTISNYEKGVAFPRFETIIKLCEILDVDPNYLFWDDLCKCLKERITEENHINKFDNLNDIGQEKAKEYIRLLSLDDKYTKLRPMPSETQYEQAAFSGKGTHGTYPKITEEST